MEALTIKTFKTSKISAVNVRENSSNYKSVAFAHGGSELPPIRVDGNFRVFKSVIRNGTIYSLAIECTGDNKNFFRKLNSAIANQSCKILGDHTVTPEDFELVKGDQIRPLHFREDLSWEIWKSQMQGIQRFLQKPNRNR